MTTIWRIMSFFSRKEEVIIETFNKNEKVGLDEKNQKSGAGFDY